jgi:hypothetical protein
VLISWSPGAAFLSRNTDRREDVTSLIRIVEKWAVHEAEELLIEAAQPWEWPHAVRRAERDAAKIGSAIVEIDRTIGKCLGVLDDLAHKELKAAEQARDAQPSRIQALLDMRQNVRDDLAARDTEIMPSMMPPALRPAAS